MNLIAVHAIQRRDAKGKPEFIAPGKPFVAAEAEAEFLLRAGAARKANGIAEAPAVPREPVSDTAPAGIELSTLTKAQLVQFAMDHEIEIDSSASKAEVLDTIEAALAVDDDLV